MLPKIEKRLSVITTIIGVGLLRRQKKLLIQNFFSIVCVVEINYVFLCALLWIQSAFESALC